MNESEERSNDFSDIETAAMAVPPSAPGALTVIAVLTLILGTIGALSAGGGLAMQGFARSFQEQVIEDAAANPERKELQVQAEIQKTSLEIADRYRLVNIATQVASLASCIALIVAAILLLRRSPFGRTMMMATLLCVLVIDLGKSVVAIAVQREMIGQMTGKVSDLVAADGELDDDKAENVTEMIGTFAQVGGIVAMVFVGGWFLLKAIFYLWSLSYLSKQHIRDFFEASPS